MFANMSDDQLKNMSSMAGFGNLPLNPEMMRQSAKMMQDMSPEQLNMYG